MTFIKAEKMPRKLKVGFSNSPSNLTHATFRDLGFAARADGTFDVYSAGGLGNHPLFGVKVAEAAAPKEILCYIKAMWLTFRAYGNYENRGKARTRYMQEACGGAEAYAAAFREKLEEVFAGDEDLTIRGRRPRQTVPETAPRQRAPGFWPKSSRGGMPGGLAPHWRPSPRPETLCAVCDALCATECGEMRLGPDETAWLVNLTGSEAMTLAALTDEGARTPV